MSFDRKTTRKARRFLKKMHEGSAKRRDANGKLVPIFGTSHVEALASMRVMLVPPARPGSGDMGERDFVNPTAYEAAQKEKKRKRDDWTGKRKKRPRKRKNAAKRNRRARLNTDRRTQ